MIYASEYNISTGSLSHILEQLQNKIGVFKANNLRKLIPAASINIKKKALLNVEDFYKKYAKPHCNLRLTVYLTIIYYLKDRSVKLLSVEYMSTDWYQLYTLNSSVNSPINNKITKIINYF